MNKRTVVALLCLLLVSQLFALFYLETFVAKMDATISRPDSNGISTISIDFNDPKNITQSKQILAPALQKMGSTLTDTGTMVKSMSNNLSIQLPPEGTPVNCTIDVPNGKGAKSAIYRVKDSQLSWYPNPQIASSWDKNWYKFATIPDCSTLKRGPDMTKK